MRNKRGEQEGCDIFVIEIGRIFPPHAQDSLRVFVLVPIPVLRVAFDRVGAKGHQNATWPPIGA
jgi:hypothetical protein